MRSAESAGYRGESREDIERDLGITPEELIRLEEELKAYRESKAEPLENISEGTLEELLARVVEKSKELDPEAKGNLKRWVADVLGIQVVSDMEEQG